jgi:hypothetical protein
MADIPQSRARRLAQACWLIAALVLAIAGPAQAQSPAKRPNIVFILSDDEDLGIHAYMPRVKALIENQGAVFENFFTTYPLCCPSRASILRGQYPHNTLVLGNLPPEGGGCPSAASGSSNRPSPPGCTPPAIAPRSTANT